MSTKDMINPPAAEWGMLINYDWCTGCHSCEIACQMEHNLPVGQSGILVHDTGHWPLDEAGDNWQFGYLPIPTKQCDTCAHRRSLGKVPTCVQHCQAQCMEFGPLDEMKAKMDHERQTLFALVCEK